MKFREANNIIANAKASMAIDGWKPPNLDSDGTRLLLNGFGYDGFVNALSDSAAGIVFTRLIEVCASGLPAVYDSELLCAIHKKIYGDLYPNAGSLRRTNTEHNGSSFTDHHYVAGSLKRLLAKLARVGSSREVSKNDFCTLLTHYYMELYLLSPFESGNGVVRRTFFALFARAKGFIIDYFKVPPKTFCEAEDLAFTTDNVTELYNGLFTATAYFNKVFDVPQTLRATKPPPPKTAVKRPRPEPRPVRKPIRSKPSAVRAEPVKEAVSDELLEEIKRQLKAELLNELKNEIAEKEARAVPPEKAEPSPPPAAEAVKVPPSVVPPVPAAAETVAVSDVAESPISKNRTVTIEPPIERNNKALSRSEEKKRSRAGKLKQKIEKLRQNLEELLSDEDA